MDLMDEYIGDLIRETLSRSGSLRRRLEVVNSDLLDILGPDQFDGTPGDNDTDRPRAEGGA